MSVARPLRGASPRRRVRCAAFAAALLGLGCAPTYGDAYLASMATGHRAFEAGRYDEAARAYDDAAAHALRVKDRDEARFLQARTYERAERFEDADRAYARLIADSPSGPRTIRAEFELADAEIERGDANRGYRLLAEAAAKHPEHGLSRHAIGRLVARAVEGGGEPGARAWLTQVTPSFAGTELAQVVSYERARSFDREGLHAEARDAYVRTAEAHPYPFGGLTDDALWRAAEIDEKLGRHAAAIADLRKLLGPREVSTMTGSYERPRYSEAQLRIARIYRDGLRDHAAARREFHKVFTDHPTSILRDDALWAEARLARTDGDARATCDLTRLLVKEIPESRYVACVRALCPDAEPAPGTRRECGDYILRELRDGVPSEDSNEPGSPG
jgi:tetratricopeptide (TPR) repeat protein